MTWWPGFGVVHHNGGTWSTRPTTGLLGESRVASAMNNIAGLLLICVGETVYGMAWEINRRLPEREGKWPNFETLMVSKDVFEFEDDAKRDAVRTLESFGCNRADDSGWCGAGTFSGAPGQLPGRRPDQALRERPVG